MVAKSLDPCLIFRDSSLEEKWEFQLHESGPGSEGTLRPFIHTDEGGVLCLQTTFDSIGRILRPMQECLLSLIESVSYRRP